ncbi:hypothetical protein YC2023_017942 [Brassica napus]
MNPTSTPFSVQTVGARKRGPKRTIFKANQTWKNPRSTTQKNNNKNEVSMSEIDHKRGKFETFFNLDPPVKLAPSHDQTELVHIRPKVSVFSGERAATLTSSTDRLRRREEMDQVEAFMRKLCFWYISSTQNPRHTQQAPSPTSQNDSSILRIPNNEPDLRALYLPRKQEIGLSSPWNQNLSISDMKSALLCLYTFDLIMKLLGLLVTLSCFELEFVSIIIESSSAPQVPVKSSQVCNDIWIKTLMVLVSVYMSCFFINTRREEEKSDLESITSSPIQRTETAMR